MQGVGTRGLGVFDLIHEVDASFTICNEVGEQYHTFQIPDFDVFHEPGTNKNGGVLVVIGKYLKACKLETKLQNTLVIDTMGLSESLRIIHIYWQKSQKKRYSRAKPIHTKKYNHFW